MGRIVSNFFITADSVVESPNLWQGDLFDESMGEIMMAGVARQDAFLMGRQLYSEWSEYWPTSDDRFGQHINPITKYVLSSTVTDPTWQNTTVIQGGEGAAERVRAVKEQTAGEIGMSGSATTVRWLLSEGLVDELALLVHPVAWGRGQRLFEDTPAYDLAVLESRTLPTGVLFVRYQPSLRP